MSSRYEIVATGTTSPMVRAAFPGFEVTSPDPETIRLQGDVADQAALHGTLHRLHDLGLAIVDVRLLYTL